ncbi:MAG TPA: MarR family winged helix-turn-helix transcriptional regulator [Puia sp.]|uniref:MarR family winged helix-turn-helix transcriptional regulator n=1 Tax=Puia sp. TaxID=2045100 RepID=UPI002C663863|nr:MarR family winged helix-turn-helix transcriptional regulator [Puia sp.]HVU95280.1 MarR family winged helix-turn-helix transcriptional regulator [Puia sp.]
MKESHISEMRAFNRWYTAMIGVLNRKWMDGDLTLPETRVLQAISMKDGITAGEIVPLLHIDKSYLSKIILRFERAKYLTKRVSAADARSYQLHLTALGRREFEKHNQMTNEFVRQMLEKLPAAECEEMIQCMRRITEILGKVE